MNVAFIGAAGFLHAILGPGFWASQSVRAALVTGGVVALVCAPVGVFTVIRGQSFAGHAFSDIAATGGSAAFLLGISPLLGFVLMGLAGAGAMEALGTTETKGRDLATGTVLGAGLGISALLLYLSTTVQTTSGAAVTVLFGSIFTVSTASWPFVVTLGAVALGLVAVVYRPLLLSSINADLAAAQGRRSGLVTLAFTVSLAISVALSSLTIGAILSTALLIGPAAAALRIAKSPGAAAGWAAGIALLCVWAGTVLAYDSYNWLPSHKGWPVSFFVVLLVLACYLLAQLSADLGRPSAQRAQEMGHGRAGRENAGPSGRTANISSGAQL